MMKDNDIYSPDIAIWEITLKCNLNCLHCGSNAGKARSNELSTEESIQLCHGLADIGCKGISLMGGELFLRKDWHIIGKEIKDLGMALSVVSNGFCNKNEIIPKLVKLQVDCVTVGLDGVAKTHDQIRRVNGSFDKAMEFLRAAKSAGLTTNAITTVHRLNFKDLPKMAILILEEGLDWQIQEATPIGRFTKELTLSKEETYYLGAYISSLHQKYPKERVIGSHTLGFHSKILPNLSLFSDWKGCYAGRSVLGIKSNGDVIGCLTLPDEFIEGNIRERSIIDIWNDENAFSYTRKFKVEEIGDNCKNCKYIESCMGGCTSRAFTLTGRSHNDPHCYYRFEEGKV